MSCCQDTRVNCFPNHHAAIAEDSVEGLFAELFGTGDGLVKTDGKWHVPAILGFPMIAGEGVVDYFIRILSSGNVLFSKGTWNSTTNYCVGSLVVYASKFWVAKTYNINSAPTTPSSNWIELLYSLEGLQGPAGQDGENGYTSGA